MLDNPLDVYTYPGLVPPSVKEGRLNIIQTLRFIDESVIGTYNRIMTENGKPDKKINCMPFHSSRIEQLTAQPPDDGSAVRIVAYRIYRGEAGALTGGVKDRQFRLRDSYRNNQDVNDLGVPLETEVLGRWVDYTVRFDVFAPTWLETETLSLDFEDLLDECTKYITAQGVIKFVNLGRSSDMFHLKTNYFNTTFTYLVRIEKAKVMSGETFARFHMYMGDSMMGTIK